MGEIRVKVRVTNAGDLFMQRQGKLDKQDVRSEEIEAVVDTGAVMTLLPRDLVERLGLHIFDKSIVTLADEQRVELDMAEALKLTIVGRAMSMDCLVGPPGCEPLIGQVVMEQLDLIPDPRLRTLTPRPESPDRPNLKMKSHALA